LEEIQPTLSLKHTNADAFDGTKSQGITGP
jgi:hypothetical protein